MGNFALNFFSLKFLSIFVDISIELITLIWVSLERSNLTAAGIEYRRCQFW